MALDPPTTLSPSKVAAFTDCALAFRFSVIDRLPEPPSIPATRGTLVHAALERLFLLPPPERTLAAALSCLDAAADSLRDDPEMAGLSLDAESEAAFLDSAEQLVRSYFLLEDPATVNPIGIEVMLDAEIGGTRLRGIIDRLELDGDGELVVTDYKTGRAPSERYEQDKLGGVHVYSLLCERNFGRRPAKVRLLYLGEPMEISTTPSTQSTRAVERKVAAVWTAIERACAADDFRPRPSRLCGWCAFQAHCPAFAGTSLVALERPEPAAAVSSLAPLGAASGVGTAGSGH